MEIESSQRQSCYNEVIRVGPNPNDCVLIRRGYLDTEMCKRKTMWRHREKTVICKLRRADEGHILPSRLVEGTNPVDTLIPNF